MKSTIVSGLFLCAMGMAIATVDPEELGQESGSHSEMSYDDHGADWTGTCATGSSQSPINLKGAYKVSLYDSSFSPLVIKYEPTPSYTILDEGHDYKLSGDFGALIAHDLDLTGVYIYNSAQFHFHAPSEHEIDGQRYPLEMHIVHNLSPDTPGNPLTIAVLGVLFKEGANNPALDTYLMPGHPSISLKDLFNGRGELDNFYMYQGSLTTPPCTETVNWYVYGEVLEASDKQIAYLNQRWLYDQNFANGNGNNREVQPLNGRMILHYDDSVYQQSFLQ